MQQAAYEPRHIALSSLIARLGTDPTSRLKRAAQAALYANHFRSCVRASAGKGLVAVPRRSWEALSAADHRFIVNMAPQDRAWAAGLSLCDLRELLGR